jgi:transposase-like protein
MVKIQDLGLHLRPNSVKEADVLTHSAYYVRGGNGCPHAARAKVIPDVTRETLQNEILNQIAPKSTVYTDRWVGYDRVKTHDFVHETVNHMQEYVRGEVHTQGIENFWSLLKRGLKGTYVAVEPFHLSRYVDEQVFRYNNRATKDNPLTDADRFMLAVSQIAGKRLTYAELTGKVGETTV